MHQNLFTELAKMLTINCNLCIKSRFHLYLLCRLLSRKALKSTLIGKCGSINMTPLKTASISSSPTVKAGVINELYNGVIIVNQRFKRVKLKIMCCL